MGGGVPPPWAEGARARCKSVLGAACRHSDPTMNSRNGGEALDNAQLPPGRKHPQCCVGRQLFASALWPSGVRPPTKRQEASKGEPPSGLGACGNSCLTPERTTTQPAMRCRVSAPNSPHTQHGVASCRMRRSVVEPPAQTPSTAQPKDGCRRATARSASDDTAAALAFTAHTNVVPQHARKSPAKSNRPRNACKRRRQR